MNISVILGHPYEKSFNHGIAATAVDTLRENGHQVWFHDLYREGFDPVIKQNELISATSGDRLVDLHCQEIKTADGLIIVHPNWWGQPPAILKGWVDRVLRENVAYTFGAEDDGSGVPTGLLKARAGIVLNTSNTPEKRENDVFGDPLERIWRDCIFNFCGIKNYYRLMFRTVAGSALEQRKEWLREVVSIMNRYFPQE